MGSEMCIRDRYLLVARLGDWRFAHKGLERNTSTSPCTASAALRVGLVLGWLECCSGARFVHRQGDGILGPGTFVFSHQKREVCHSVNGYVRECSDISSPHCKVATNTRLSGRAHSEYPILNCVCCNRHAAEVSGKHPVVTALAESLEWCNTVSQTIHTVRNTDEAI